MVKKKSRGKPATDTRSTKHKKSSLPKKKAAVAPNRITPQSAGQADLSPPVSIDSPWDNLHPERIWPD